MQDPYFRNHAVYQIYPMSFCDSNHDGKGDIKGIISKLEYLQRLGIHILWISPLYVSPMKDMGYDVADYYNINPIFGTMKDFEDLVQEAKKRDIRIIMDLVVNHTSDQCVWFQSALKDKKSPYRDYYIFREGKGKDHREAPNNWKSHFLGSAWEEVKDEPGMFYLHLFSKEQPDLNWHNPKVLEEVEKIMNFWMNKGVYGFRCDVISLIYKDTFADGKKRSLTSAVPVGSEHYTCKEGCHQIIKKLRKDVIEPHHGVLVGECLGMRVEDAPKFLDEELDTYFPFEHVSLNANKWSKEAINPEAFKESIIKWQTHADWNGNYLENHDQHRSINKYVKHGFEIMGSKMLLTLIYTLRGTPFIYMGEEFGSEDYPEGSFGIEDSRDCVTKFIYQMARGFHLLKFLAYRKARHNGRDDPRAPMAFTRGKGYGFTDAEVTPWQKFNPLSAALNAENAFAEKDSPIYTFISLNQLREKHSALSEGSISFLPSPRASLYYLREDEKEKLLILLNLEDRPKDISPIYEKYDLSDVFLSNTDQPLSYGLAPYGAFILRLNKGKESPSL